MKRARGVMLLCGAVLMSSAVVHAADGWEPAPGTPVRPADVRAFSAETEARGQRLKQVDADIATRQRRVVALGRRYVRAQRAGALAMVSDIAHLFAYVDRESRVRRQLINDLGQSSNLHRERSLLNAELAQATRDSERLGGQAALWTQDGGEARRDEAFAKAFAGGSDYQAVGDGTVASPFARARGQLLTPVASAEPARVVHREGAEGPGLEFRAVRGAPVRAAFAGRVAFSDRFGPYGRMVILDHGDHYYTVYGDLGVVAVRVGDEVGAGAKIGHLGEDGRGVAYVEVRHRAETVEPGLWFGE